MLLQFSGIFPTMALNGEFALKHVKMRNILGLLFDELAAKRVQDLHFLAPGSTN
jgi:hypothetical protein